MHKYSRLLEEDLFDEQITDQKILQQAVNTYLDNLQLAAPVPYLSTWGTSYTESDSINGKEE